MGGGKPGLKGGRPFPPPPPPPAPAPPPATKGDEPVLPPVGANERPHDGPQENDEGAPRRIASLSYNLAMTTLERDEAAEHALIQELDRTVVKSAIYTSADRDPQFPLPRRDNVSSV